MPALLANPALLGVAISGAGALGQGIASAVTAGKRRRAEKELEAEVGKMQVPESITDYYNKAYARYSPNAYQSAEYNQQMRNILANQATGISALQSRRSALAGLPSITQGTNLASQRAVAAAEGAQRANLAQLGGAAGTLAQQQNLIRQAKLNLKAQKAAALAGTQNILAQGATKSLGNAATLGMYAGLGGSTTSPTKPDFSKYLTTPTLASEYATQDYYQAPITPRYSDIG
jgi:hypothetical protein